MSARVATLAFTDEQWNSLAAALDDPRESAAVLLAGQADTPQGLLLCVNSICWVPDDAYEERTERSLVIRSSGWMHALRKAADGGWLPILVHTHPGNSAHPSSRDDRVDERLAASFQTRSASEVYASVIIGGTADRPTFTGRVRTDAATVDIDRLRVVGKSFRIDRSENSGGLPPSVDVFDRHVRAFGVDGQRVLQSLRVGVVGCGGTGSAVLEQLLRLGVGSLTFVDFDIVTASNVTRIYGSTLSDVERPKVEVLRDHLARVGFDTELRPIRGNVMQRQTMEQIRGCDVIFGCTDDDGGRAVLSRLAYWYLLPVIDMGVQITSTNGRIGGVFGRTTLAVPGEPCLLCRGEVDPVRAREERLASAERRALAEEGYAQGLADRDPAVISYTTMVASFAVSDLIQRMFGFGISLPGRQLLQISDRGMRRQAGSSRDGCYCATPDKWGRADVRSPLGITWAQ